MPDFAREVRWLWTISVHNARKPAWKTITFNKEATSALTCWSLLGLAPGNISRPEQLLLLRDPGGSAKGSYKMKFLNINIWPGGPDHHIQNSYVDNVDIDSLIDDIIWMLGIMKLTLSNAPAQVESFWTVSLPQYQWQAIIDNVNIVNAIDNNNDNTKNNRERCNRST